MIINIGTLFIIIAIMALEGFVICKMTNSQHKLMKEEIDQLIEENIMLKDQVAKWEERIKRNAGRPS
jgi:hypothetical protein